MFNNWALFCSSEDEQPLWTYGNLSEEAQRLTIGFLKGLHNIGQELFDKNIASLHLSQTQTHTYNQISEFLGDELFIINLEGAFFLLIFDPTTTIKMLDSVDIPDELDMQIRSVLIGQASVQYANMSINESKGEKLFVDSFFQTALNEILTKEEQEQLNVFVSEGSCSFSGLNGIQCLTFHYLLRSLFETEYISLIGTPWSIIQHNSAIPVYLEFDCPKKGHLLSGYLSIINDYIKTLFKSQLQSLVFGGSTELVSIDLIHGNENFMSISRPLDLFQDFEFLAAFENMDSLVKKDLTPNLIEYLSKKLSDIYWFNFRKKKLNILIYKMGNPEIN